MKKTIAICLILCILIQLSASQALAAAAGGSEATTATSPDDSIVAANTCHTLDADSTLLGTGKLIENAKAAILYEATSETLMYAWNADEKMYPASLVKILTALIAVENGKLEDTVTVTESAIASLPIDAVSADLVAGEQITLEDLLYCLLVGSANDAAVVIAEHISGSQNSFVQLMNQYAKDLKCAGTQFTNAHGLHNADQYTTARDAARILSAAIKNDVFRSIFTAAKHTVPATNKSEERSLGSNNALLDPSSKLYYDARVIGGRTGVTEDGRRCIATAAESNGMLLISVVMGSETEYQEDGYSAIRVGGYHETTALLDAGFTGYKCAQILFADQTLRQCEVIDADSDVVLGPHVSVSAVLPETVNAADLTMRYADTAFRAPIEAGQKLSTVQIWHGNVCVAQTELYAMNSVGMSNSVQLVEDSDNKQGGFSIAIWILLGIGVAAALLYVLIRFARWIRITLSNHRSKRYRRSRRRSH